MSQFRASHVIVEWINGGDGAKRVSHAIVEWIEEMEPKYLAVPKSDDAVGSWVNESLGTTNLYQSIDDIIPDDLTYIESRTSV